MVKQLRFTQKQWNRFDLIAQQILIRKYEVIITDHKTMNEKVVSFLTKIDISSPQGKKNLDSGIMKIHKYLDSFDDAMDSLSDGFRKSVASGSKDDPVEIIFGKRKH